MRRVALLTALCFGCATTRPPGATAVDLSGEAPRHVSIAEPTLELWMEGTRPPDPAETARALSASRSALAAALDGREPEVASGTVPDAFLMVKERAVARTGERQTAQLWSVVGVVFVIAFVVVAALLWNSGSSAPKKPATGTPPQTSARVVPAPGPWQAPRAYVPPPSPFFFGWSVGVSIPLSSPAPEPYPMPMPDAAAAEPLPYAPPPTEVPPPPEAPPPPPSPSPTPVPAAVAGPDPLLDDRGWFDGDEVELTAELVDARNGSVLWRRALRTSGDPRDARDVSALLDRLVAGQPFAHKQPPRTIGVRRDEAPGSAAPPAPAEPFAPSSEGDAGPPAASPPPPAESPGSALPDAGL